MGGWIGTKAVNTPLSSLHFFEVLQIKKQTSSTHFKTHYQEDKKQKLRKFKTKEENQRDVLPTDCSQSISSVALCPPLALTAVIVIPLITHLSSITSEQ